MTTTHPPGSWTPTVARRADGNPVVVVDFSRLAAGRDAVDVVAEAFPDRTVLRFDPVTRLSGMDGAPSLDQLAAAAAAGLAGEGRTPDLVIGYCSGAPLAMRLVALLEELADVQLLLLAPGFPIWEHVESDLAEVLTTITGSPVRSSPVPHDPAAARRHAAAAIDEALDSAAEAMGLGAEEAAVLTVELGARYKAWIDYLVCAVDDEVLQVQADLCVLEMPETWASPELGWPTHAVRVATDVPRDALLDSAEVAATVRAMAGALT